VNEDRKSRSELLPPATSDVKEELEKLLSEAADCELIGSLATDVSKRASFRRTAEELRRRADELKADSIRQDIPASKVLDHALRNDLKPMTEGS
jgi:hypothetical protein